MSSAGHLAVAVRPAVEGDIAKLSDAMAGEVSAEQLENRCQEHVAGY